MKITDIKAALKDRLALIPGFGGRIFVDRARPYEDPDLPCLEITFDGADPERKIEHYIHWRARIGLSVQVKAAETERPDTTAEALLGDVQASLYADPSLDGVLPDELEFGSITADEDAGGDRVVRRLKMEVIALYNEELYPVALTDFGSAAINIDMASPRNDPQTPATPDGQIDAAVIVTLP